MKSIVRRFASKAVGAVLPQTTAAAGCAKECWKDYKKSGGQVYGITCCIWEDCRARCA
ncbi:hypothetical protein ABTX80_04400 [Streptomyces erythrochromogenes]|uniref:hypothetical protein n=1 Tax=Streptomyces erythrochromogenes TaxID=285574 RepID=UPI00331DC309